MISLFHTFSFISIILCCPCIYEVSLYGLWKKALHVAISLRLMKMIKIQTLKVILNQLFNGSFSIFQVLIPQEGDNDDQRDGLVTVK